MPKMTQPTKEELIAARDAFIVGCHGCLDPEMEQTILSLLDSHINPPDLSELKREVASYEPQCFLDEGYNTAIDHLAPRISDSNFLKLKHDKRVSELLEYNNIEVEKRRKADAEVIRLTRRLNSLGYDIY